MTPTVFVAQSPDDVYIKIQLQEGMDRPLCPTSYDELVEVTHKYVSIRAVCFTDEVVIYKALLKLSLPVVESLSVVQWQSEAVVVLTLRKQDAPSFWGEIITESIDGELKLGVYTQVWKQFKDQMADYRQSQDEL